MTQVGKGAFSCVYKVGTDIVAKKYNVGRMFVARYQDTNTDYGIVTDESCWESFNRESNIYSKLRCSNIEHMFCRYKSHDPSTATLCIELGQQITGHQWESSSETIVIHLAQALASLHSIGIVHGDIKTDNTVRVRDRYTLIDFGCSIDVESSPLFQRNWHCYRRADIRALKEMLSAVIPKWTKDSSLSVLFDTVYSLYIEMRNKVTRLP
jgi:serine/threonine protein kinase